MTNATFTQSESGGVSPDASRSTSGAASILICTRNRPEDLIQALPGVMAQDYPDYEVVIIDQSTNDESERLARESFPDDPRLRYIRTDTVGLSIARNMALEAARNEICAFTDDDCQIPPHWLRNIVEYFAANPQADVLFSPVHVPPDKQGDPGLCFPCLYFDEARPLRRWEIFGMGANMTLRKSIWQRVGPFDPMLGPGAPLPGSDEHDWMYRAHRLGAALHLEPRNPIVHRAWRTIPQWQKLHLTYAYGDAAFAMKHVRAGDFAATRHLVGTLVRRVARIVKRLLNRTDHRFETAYLRGYCRGIVGSLRFPVDSACRLYAAPRRNASTERKAA